MAKPVPIQPWDPAKLDEDEIRAIKALAKGVANDAQQKRALDIIIAKMARTYDLSFRPGDGRHTDFSEGKRFVGLQLVGVINMVMPEKPDPARPTRPPQQ